MVRKVQALVATWLLALSSCGCPTAQQWFQIGAGLIPIVLQTVTSLRTPSGSLSPNAEATLTKFSGIATTILNDAAADFKTAATTSGVIPKINAELTQLQTQAQALIPQFTGNAKVLAWVNAILADTTDIVNLVPVIQGVVSPAMVGQMTPMKYQKAKALKGVFQERLKVLQAAS